MTELSITSEPESTPEIYSTSEPEYEITQEPEVEPEYEPTAEPEVEPEYEPESEPESEGWPEPGPEWQIAYQEWGAAWPVHIYLFSLIFILLGLLAFIYIVSLCIKTKGAIQSKLTISLLTMIFLFNITRGLTLLINPYSTVGNITALGTRLLWSFGLPGLTSSFSLVMLVLLDTTRMTIGPPRFQKLSTIIAISVAHLVIVYTSDLVVYLHADAKSMLVVCQTLFITYGLMLTVGYCYVGVRIHQNCKAGAQSNDGNVGAIRRLTCLSFISAATACAICVTHIYSAVSEFGVYSNVRYTDSWSWWCLQSLMRLEEIMSSTVVFCIVSNSVNLKLKVFIQNLVKCCRNSRKDTKVIPVISTPHTSQICTIELTANSRSDDSSW